MIFSLWEVELPDAITDWIKYGESMISTSLSELLLKMPVTDDLPEDTLFILVRENDEFVLYSGRVGAEFIEEYAHEGSSDRADLAYIVSCIQ